MIGQDKTLIAAAQALCAQGRFADAATALDRAVAIAPDASAPRAMLGDVLLQLGRPRSAATAFEGAVQRDPFLHSVCRIVDDAVTEEARSRTAVENCRQILARYPRFAPAHYDMACALLNLGRKEEACRAAERALMIDATVPTYYHPLIHAGNDLQRTRAVAMLEQLEQHEDALDPLDRASLHFLLAKAYDGQKRHAPAFDHYAAGNAIKRTLVKYDEARELGELHAIAAAFTPDRLAALRGTGCTSTVPIFVLGMPRSGTSLVEQILASHPDVHGAGEITALPDLIAGHGFSSDFATASAERLARLGADYAAKLTAIAPTAARVVDKLPNNFRHIGAIHLALPRARILHVRRDPLDTCFSCFQQNFNGALDFSYDQAELGRYYKAYDALMAHWHAVLPADAILDVHYEELVRDLPGVARRMIAYCDLAWDPRCLDFHKTERAVATASFDQVRQPVYQSAVRKVDAYLPYLSALRAALA